MSQPPVSVLAALNAQLTVERTAHATYRAMAMSLEALNFPGMAAWLRKSSDEEQSHADKIALYIADRGDAPSYGALDPVYFGKSDAPQNYFKNALKLEQEVTASLKEKHAVCLQDDSQAALFLQWFLMEQVESEKIVEEICDMFQRAGAGLGYIVMDERLAEMAN